MKKDKFELRMIGLVPYNIMPIQQGIQFGHSKDEMALKQIERLLVGANIDARFLDWLRNWKTYIILNGGTTNKRTSIDTGEPIGTLNQHLLTLGRHEIDFSTFYEEDLGDQLTAITFIVDERVFDKEKYPDFVDEYIADPSRQFTVDEFWSIRYKTWVDDIGGPKNAFLREFLKPFKLA